jgi:predicted Zn finger-like uncharacterized protein
MYTQCPDCQTRFRVTAGVLRAAHGTVRCGRCGSAFDALERLSDSLEPSAPALEPLVISVPPLQLPPTDDRSLVESAAEPADVLVDETSTTETITLEGERVSVDMEPEATEPQVESETVDESAINFELGDDLDATDRYEVLEIANAHIPDERDAERELEALVQRLQREFGEDIVESAGHDEDTAETEWIAEPPTPELAPEAPVFVDVSPAGVVSSVPEFWNVPAMTHGEAAPVDREIEVRGFGSPGPELEPAPLIEAAPEPGTPRPEPSARPAPRVTPELAAPEEPAWPQQEPATVIRSAEPVPLSAQRFRPTSIDTEQEAGAERSAGSTIAWSVGSLLLAVVLAAQVVNHWRDELARDARFGGLLRAAYGGVGIDLPPSRDLEALQLQQLGVEDRDSGRMVVRANLTNHAKFTQPMPVLRLQLEDRYGSMIAARNFEPSEYLSSTGTSEAMLAPGESSEAELVLADPGKEAVGYRLDVCLRDTSGQLLCAQPPGPG